MRLYVLKVGRNFEGGSIPIQFLHPSVMDPLLVAFKESAGDDRTYECMAG
jgi:hypothetical protein